jgi:hypothetical protein
MVFGLVLLAVLTRIVPHPPNFSPLVAIAIFSTAYFPDKRWGMLLPALAFFVGDCFLGVAVEFGVYSGWMANTSGFYKGSPILYLIMTLITPLGYLLRDTKDVKALLGSTLMGSILFFFLSNFMVWARGSMYTHDLAGMVNCYTMAIPFFSNEVLGSLFYMSSFFLIAHKLNWNTETKLQLA